MNAIWKFEMVLEDEPTIEMPVGARPLSVGVQKVSDGDMLVLWAHIPDTTQPMERRHFFILGTGNPIQWQVEESTFIGTVQMESFVWHVFDQRKTERV